MRAFSVALALLMVLAVHGSPAQGAPRTPCERVSGKTRADGRLVRVLSRDGRLYACDRATRRRVLLDIYGCEPDSCAVAEVHVAGSYVAWVRQVSGRLESADHISVAAVPSGRIISEFLDAPGPVTDLVVRANGASAWIMDVSIGAERAHRVERASARGTLSLLARGADIDPLSLRRDGSRVSWLQGGARHFAALP
ncbi:MAG: hypothetical protein H0T43_00230 [Solirubrobacterales bacterium]|nr:hypothetical protein [Solirubrobacterales bacterium]